MHRFYVGDMSAYDFFGVVGYYIVLFTTLFYYKTKRNTMGLHSRKIIFFASKINEKLGKVVEFVLVAFESYLAVLVIDLAIGNFNRSFGNFIGTGANYFGMLLTVLFFWIILAFILMVNPLKLLDLSTLSLPLYLIFIKISCYCAGCCYGIPWEYGPYNHNPNNPGNQVPVQLIEAFWALAIFIFLLWYRKKAKKGTLFPIYMILYSATRFCSEFLRNESNVLGPLKIYHLLCLVGIAYGFLHLLFLHFYRDDINRIFNGAHDKLDKKIEQYYADQIKRDEALKRKKTQTKKKRSNHR